MREDNKPGFSNSRGGFAKAKLPLRQFKSFCLVDVKMVDHF